MTAAPDWLRLDAEHTWHPYTQHALDPEPLPVVGARGAWLELADGRRLLDGISSWWCCLHGHSHPRLVAALRRQAEELDHVLYAGCAHEGAARLAAELVRSAAPLAADVAEAPLTRVFYSDDGSTAVEVAIKAAYGLWVRRGEPRRTRFLALEGGYHGDTFGAMAAGDPNPFFREFAPFLFRVERIPADSEALASTIQAHPGEIAALLVEPMVQGAAGMVFHSPSFLRDARRLCSAAGIPLIADEVMTGFCRTGSLYACQHAGIVPDLLCLSKGLTGGMLPLAVTLATEDVFAAFRAPDRARAFFHGHTFTANPLGCAVARASLALCEEDDVPARMRIIGERIAAEIAPLRSHAMVAGIRHLGGIVAIQFHASDGGYLAGLGDTLRAACRRLPEVLLRPLGNVLYALPPACLDPSECELVAAAMTRVVEDAGSYSGT